MIIRITGGIGNQMFQYAFKKKIDQMTGTNNQIDVRFYSDHSAHNGYELQSVFGIKDNEYNGSLIPPSEKHKYYSRLCYYLNKRMIVASKYMIEVMINYSDAYKSAMAEDYYFDGYWQSQDYFQDIEDEIRNTFVFPGFDEDKNIEICKTAREKNCVSLHVRRGDFLKASKFVALGSGSYYDRAVSLIKSKVDDPVFIVMSDDIEWCREHFNEEKMIFVDWNSGSKSYRDMQIMSICKHNIVANSSFSWWGAWLNNNPEKIVIAPSRFYTDNKRDESHILPAEWTKISV